MVPCIFEHHEKLHILFTNLNRFSSTYRPAIICVVTSDTSYAFALQDIDLAVALRGNIYNHFDLQRAFLKVKNIRD
jgi:hypothetical protein